MPEMLFHVRWPDGNTEVCYSPSLVVADHLCVGESYTVMEFLDRCRTALSIASERVREKYGVPCRRALNQLAKIEKTADGFRQQESDRVTVVSFER